MSIRLAVSEVDSLWDIGLALTKEQGHTSPAATEQRGLLPSILAAPS